MQTESQVDISMNLSTFFLKNVGVWMSDNPNEQRQIKMLLINTTWILLSGIVINGRDLYFTLLYHGDILYSITNNITMIMALIKISIIIIYKGKFLNLIACMQQNFWKVNYDYREKEILNDCRKTCIFFVSCLTTMVICAMISYLIIPFIAKGNNESERMLPFNMWINLPLSKTPYYEIMFLIQAMCVYYIGVASFCFDNIFCIMAVHLAGQFRILQYRLTKLYDVECIEMHKKDSILANRVPKFYEKFRKCVQHHQALIDFYQNLENVYTRIAFGEMLVYSILICLFGYQVLVATASFARRSIFVFLLNGSTFLLFMVTYSCNGVIEHSDNVAIGAYSALWTIVPMDKFGRMLRKDLIMVITRSRRVCCLTANGFFPVSLESYTKILSTALSYFTLLSNRVETANDT
ncbi:odorant receptor 13a [Apis mellifera]|uniref:Odorant receptor n=1 Tax=Apis mellifera TaxID=7460 RepID=A0A7M7GDN7_APIME|nr:odorant receptor 13a [Apis mellifera]|eukprot:XP_003249268.2 odorant receptor 13a [Apis mellifera]